MDDGNPFIFPSLGPTAFLLATEYRFEVMPAREVIGGHAIGAVSGFVVYHLLADGLALTATLPGLSAAQLRLVISGLLALVLTTAGMLRLDAVHPPACATTLIVALGLLSTVFENVMIVVSVVTFYLVHRVAVARVFDASG